MPNYNKKAKRRYNRTAFFYDLLERPMEMVAVKKWRLQLMDELEGKVLEIGVGTGRNIDYYPDNLNITAIDFSEKMLARAKQRAAQLNKNVELLLMDAERMTFPDDYFDTVFTTCVFCSVPNPIKGLQEIRRVCKPGGKVIMIEHVRSEKKVIGMLMDLFNPLTVAIHGTNINRKTVDNIYKSGFTNVNVENLTKDIVKKIVIINDK